ncbi:iron ABC transporter permease [Rhizobium sp. P44RR-XXIV]|uniref:ABC transporter permease n=1 Tax=Rhizobium sp. P44RR-XXIV TaxID=1921145 RepID=UPI000985D024|nr:iron ABC transporter permease [Rhizobium sp. P44RR-XXIV]TIX87454.1 iron ABC transporter permease [Rhizobium sp. P44RR-XXIV]
MSAPSTPVSTLSHAGRPAAHASQNFAPIPQPGNALGFRRIVIGLLAVIVLAPIALIIYQSLLDGPFFARSSKLSIEAYRYILTDEMFYDALWNTVIMAVGMVAIAVPLGAALSFLLTRTDVKFRKALEVVVLVPMFISAIVLAFGYTVAVGPSGFLTMLSRDIFGAAPWNLYSLTGIVIVTGLAHVPHVYLYVAAAMRNLPSDLEEAARSMGSPIWRVCLDVTLPMVLPALVFATALNLLIGFEMFGVPYVLGDPSGIVVLTTYVYKLTTLFGVPTYQLMAVVVVLLVLLTLPLVWYQRRLLRHSRRYAALGGKGARTTVMRLGATGQIIALSFIGFWLFVSVLLPIGGIVLRAFVDAWGQGVNPLAHLTVAHFATLVEVPSLFRGIVNTVILAVVGGAAAVAIYLVIGLAGHRHKGLSNTVLDYMVLLPRAMPSLIIGLAFFWLFLFIPFLIPLRTTLISLFAAYVIVGLSYGLRLLQGTLIQVSPELEEAARTTGATIGRSWRDIVIPIIRPGLVGAWALIMIVFLRDYATGIYLMSAGAEVIGSLMMAQLQSGAMDTIAALAFVSILLTGGGLALALRLGAKIHD